MAQQIETQPLDVSDPAAVATLGRVRPGGDRSGGTTGRRCGGRLSGGRNPRVRSHRRRAAQLEGSKDFAKQIMVSAGIPTAESETVSDAEALTRALDRFGAPTWSRMTVWPAARWVVTDDREAALKHGRACLAAGSRVLLEEYLDGPEASVFCICDGTTVVPLLPAQDFKRVGDGDTGPNTGGMGAYCPLPWADPDLAQWTVEHVAQPALDEMARRGTAYQGVLYVGLALTSKGPRVVEFNVRFGDPRLRLCWHCSRRRWAGCFRRPPLETWQTCRH